MKKMLVAVAVFAFTLPGCEPAVVTTPAPSNRDNEKGVHIRAPGVNVDIEKRGKDGKVDVDVQGKDKNP